MAHLGRRKSSVCTKHRFPSSPLVLACLLSTITNIAFSKQAHIRRKRRWHGERAERERERERNVVSMWVVCAWDTPHDYSIYSSFRPSAVTSFSLPSISHPLYHAFGWALLICYLSHWAVFPTSLCLAELCAFSKLLIILNRGNSRGGSGSRAGGHSVEHTQYLWPLPTVNTTVWHYWPRESSKTCTQPLDRPWFDTLSNLLLLFLFAGTCGVDVYSHWSVQEWLHFEGCCPFSFLWQMMCQSFCYKELCFCHLPCYDATQCCFTYVHNMSRHLCTLRTEVVVISFFFSCFSLFHHLLKQVYWGLPLFSSLVNVLYVMLILQVFFYFSAV